MQLTNISNVLLQFTNDFLKVQSKNLFLKIYANHIYIHSIYIYSISPLKFLFQWILFSLQ